MEDPNQDIAVKAARALREHEDSHAHSTTIASSDEPTSKDVSTESTSGVSDFAKPNPTLQHPSTGSSTSSDLTTPVDTGLSEKAANGDANKRPELVRQQSRADEFSKVRILIIMFSLCTALFLSALDVTIITTALPTIAQHFGASSSGYTWIGSSYLLANASATPLWGKFSDIWGRKPMLIMANLVFMIGSLVAALATSIGMLIGGRVIQGLGGGGLIILVNIAISDLFSMRDRPKYYAFVGATWAIASGVGPVSLEDPDSHIFTNEFSIDRRRRLHGESLMEVVFLHQLTARRRLTPSPHLLPQAPNPENTIPPRRQGY